jgi:ApaG protein
MIMKNKIEVNVEVEVAYLPDQSSLVSSKYAYAYTITITNNGETGVQLRTRRWLIQDESGETEEVIGEGVIGQQPHLSPGESFKYSSGAVIRTETGTMKGSYGMISDQGQRFDAMIPEFTLSEPYTLH